jgi:hypothetical protein
MFQNVSGSAVHFHTAIDCGYHYVGIYTGILLSLLSFSVKMTMSPSGLPQVVEHLLAPRGAATSKL